MSSLHRQAGKQNWYCAFTDSTGTRRFRSTGTPDKRQAKVVCEGWQKTANLGKKGKLTPERAREVISATVSDVFQFANTESLPSTTFRAWIKQWLDAKAIEKESSSVTRYSKIVNSFLASVGPKADRDMETITTEDVVAFRDCEAKRVSVSSANLALKIVRALLSDAVARQYAPRNVAAPSLVKILKERGESKRRNLSLDEIKLLLERANQEWKGLILFGIYTGQRLGDIAKLTWRAVDLEENEVAFVTQKTGKRLRIPLAAPLKDYLSQCPAPDKPDAPLFLKCSTAKRVGHLSNQFRNLLADVGLMKVTAHQAKSGKGRNASRETSELSFHSLRHSAVSMLKSAGVTDSMARAIIGHCTEVVSRRYTHFSQADMSKAINKLPDITR